MPKPNMYQSLHTTVIGPEGEHIEIQIRTEKMHYIAEYGVAAHWKYKDKNIITPKDEKRFSWLRQILDWERELKDPKEFIHSLKIDLFEDEVYVFTPRRDVLALPQGATPVDFAYMIHSEVGDRCVGARVNGKLVPLNTKLKNGDIVEITTSKNVSPSLHWLTITKTGKARAAIRRYWHSRKELKENKIKKYNTTLWISLPDKPGKLGEVTTLLGQHELNISGVEMKEKTKEYINFRFHLNINVLKNFTKFISELKQKELKFKIIRHEDKKYAFTKKIFKYFKKN